MSNANPDTDTDSHTHATHGGAGTFDINMPLTGHGIECRNGAGNYTAVLTFDMPVNGGTAAVTSGTGSAGSVSFSGNDMIVSLTGVTDIQPYYSDGE